MLPGVTAERSDMAFQPKLPWPKLISKAPTLTWILGSEEHSNLTSLSGKKANTVL